MRGGAWPVNCPALSTLTEAWPHAGENSKRRNSGRVKCEDEACGALHQDLPSITSSCASEVKHSYRLDDGLIALGALSGPVRDIPISRKNLSR